VLDRAVDDGEDQYGHGGEDDVVGRGRDAVHQGLACGRDAVCEVRVRVRSRLGRVGTHAAAVMQVQAALSVECGKHQLERWSSATITDALANQH